LAEGEDDEEDEDQVKEAETRVRKEAVWKEIFLTSNGRDKAFVCHFKTPYLPVHTFSTSYFSRFERNLCSTLFASSWSFILQRMKANFCADRRAHHGRKT
jgi:hypothetical protein